MLVKESLDFSKARYTDLLKQNEERKKAVKVSSAILHPASNMRPLSSSTKGTPSVANKTPLENEGRGKLGEERGGERELDLDPLDQQKEKGAIAPQTAAICFIHPMSARLRRNKASALEIQHQQEEEAGLNELPWWKRLVLDTTFRRRICSGLTRKIRHWEEEYGEPLSLVVESGAWDPKNTRNRLPGNGFTYHWLTAFPPVGFVQVSPTEHNPNPKPVKAGKLCINVYYPQEISEEQLYDPNFIINQALKAGTGVPSMTFTRLQDTISDRFAKTSSLHQNENGGSEKQQTPKSPSNRQNSAFGMISSSEAQNADDYQFLGTLRQSFRLVRWKLLSEALQSHHEQYPKDLSVSSIEGMYRFVKNCAVMGYKREDLTEARYDYLFASEMCQSAVRKIYFILEKDINGRITKNAFIEFTLNVYNLVMPSFYAQSNIDLAEDEWICRGTKEKPDFYIFYRFWFDLPFLICRREFMNEEQYVEVWDFISHCIFQEKILNRDRYAEHVCAQEMVQDERLRSADAGRRALLIYRKAEVEHNKKAREEKLHRLHEMVRLQNENKEKKRWKLLRQPQQEEGREEQHEREGNVAADSQHLFKSFDLVQKLNPNVKRPEEFGGVPFRPIEESGSPNKAGKAPSGFDKGMLSTNKSSALTLFEDNFTVQDLPRDDLDDLLDFCSDFSDSDFDDDKEPIRDRFQLSLERQQHRAEREKEKQKHQNVKVMGAMITAKGLASRKMRHRQGHSEVEGGGEAKNWYHPERRRGHPLEEGRKEGNDVDPNTEERSSIGAPHEEEEEGEGEIDWEGQESTVVEDEDNALLTGLPPMRIVELRHKERNKIHSLVPEKKGFNVFNLPTPRRPEDPGRRPATQGGQGVAPIKQFVASRKMLHSASTNATSRRKEQNPVIDGQLHELVKSIKRAPRITHSAASGVSSGGHRLLPTPPLTAFTQLQTSLNCRSSSQEEDEGSHRPVTAQQNLAVQQMYRNLSDHHYRRRGSVSSLRRRSKGTENEEEVANEKTVDDSKKEEDQSKQAESQKKFSTSQLLVSPNSKSGRRRHQRQPAIQMVYNNYTSAKHIPIGKTGVETTVLRRQVEKVTKGDKITMNSPSKSGSQHPTLALVKMLHKQNYCHTLHNLIDHQSAEDNIEAYCQGKKLPQNISKQLHNLEEMVQARSSSPLQTNEVLKARPVKQQPTVMTNIQYQ